MAKSPFTKPTIEGPRKRIPVDDTVRAEARAGMGGEQTRLESEEKATAPSEPVAALAPAPPEPIPAPTMAATPPPASAAPNTMEPAAAGELAPVPATAPAVLAATPVERRPRGRKPALVYAQPAGELKGVRISESDWSDIRKILVQLPKGADMPTNIIGYLHTAHKHYEAHLRKTGKLPAS